MVFNNILLAKIIRSWKWASCGFFDLYNLRFRLVAWSVTKWFLYVLSPSTPWLSVEARNGYFFVIFIAIIDLAHQSWFCSTSWSCRGSTSLSEFDITRQFGRWWIEPIWELAGCVMSLSYIGKTMIVTCIHYGNSSFFGLFVFEISAFFIQLQEIIKVLILFGHVRINNYFTLLSINLFYTSLREGYDFVLNW